MKRRTLLRKLGAASVATVGVAGTASAAPGSAVNTVLEHSDVEVDVSDVDGRVPLASLLDDDQVRRLPADVDPAETEVWVSRDVDVLREPACCCNFNCDPDDCPCCVDCNF